MEHLLFLFIQLFNYECCVTIKKNTVQTGCRGRQPLQLKFMCKAIDAKAFWIDSDLRNIFQLPCTTTLAIVCGQKSDDMV